MSERRLTPDEREVLAFALHRESMSKRAADAIGQLLASCRAADAEMAGMVSLEQVEAAIYGILPDLFTAKKGKEISVTKADAAIAKAMDRLRQVTNQTEVKSSAQ